MFNLLSIVLLILIALTLSISLIDDMDYTNIISEKIYFNAIAILLIFFDTLISFIYFNIVSFSLDTTITIYILLCIAYTCLLVYALCDIGNKVRYRFFKIGASLWGLLLCINTIINYLS